MKVKFYLLLVALMSILTACGGDGKDKVGSLTLAVTSSALQGGQYAVNATATYTNPNTANLVGTEVTFNTSPTGLINGFPQTISMPSNGIQGINFTVTQLNIPINFFVTATTGSLQDSKSVSIPALGTVVATPTTLTFAATDGVSSTKTVSITGGTAPYTAISSNTALVTTSVSGSTVTVTRVSAGTGNPVVTISDSATTPTTVSVSVSLL